MSGFKAREATLQNLFDSGDYDQFVIPHYQRSYVWGQDELENFWNDFIERKEVGSFIYLAQSLSVGQNKNVLLGLWMVNNVLLRARCL